MRLIRFLLRNSRRTVILAVLTGVASGVCSAGLLAVVNLALTGGKLSHLTLVWSFIALAVLVPVARSASEVVLLKLGQDTIFGLRVRLSQAVLEVPLRRLEEIGAPRVLACLTDDVQTISLVIGQIPLISINSALLLGSLAYLGWLSWRVLIVVVVLIGIGAAGYQLPIFWAARYMRRARALSDELYQSFRALTLGAKELKQHRGRREAFLGRELAASAEAFRQQSLKGFRIFVGAASWGQSVLFLVIGLLLFAVPALTGAGMRTVTGYTLTLLYMMGPLQILMNVVPHFGRASIALSKVEELGADLVAASRTAGADDGAAPRPSPGWQRIELRAVTHRYRKENEEGSFELGPIDLSLGPGELIFIAGGNGSGKTTLGKLLSGLYRPDSGEIRCDGQTVDDTSIAAYRERFSVVFSDCFLFRSLLGMEGGALLDENAAAILRQLHLDRQVTVEDGRFSTIDLSTGQRKRLALLTALLEDRPVYLFDEWAADQDPWFKEVFYRQVLPMLKRRGKAVIAITHDDRYYDEADRLIKLEDGKIAAESVRALAGLAAVELGHP